MKQKFCSLSLAAIFFIVPGFSYAGIVINEIMYDVSGTDSGREWVEIYNPDSQSTDISNYKFLESSDASNHGLTLVTGSATIPQNGYAVIVSDSSKFLADNPGFGGTVLKASFGSLNNNGSTIILKSGTTIVDQVTYTSSLGAAGTGNSLQKTSNGFIPAVPTPGAQNALVAVSEGTGSSSGGGSGAGTTTENTATTSNISTSTNVTNSNNTEILSAHSRTQIVTYVINNPELKADAGRHRITTVNVPIEFEAEISGLQGNISYDWSFGDGTTGMGKIVNHSYVFSGDYVVVLNVNNGVNRAVSRTEVKAVPSSVSIIGVDRTLGYVELQNSGEYEVNIQNWKIHSGNNELVFPQDTIIKPNGNIKFPFKFGGDNLSQVILTYGDNVVGSVFGDSATESVSYVSPTREEIEIAKAKVAKQFELENSEAPTLNIETLHVETSDSAATTSTSTSILDTLETSKKEDNSSLLAAPFRFFKLLKNFITK